MGDHSNGCKVTTLVGIALRRALALAGEPQSVEPRGERRLHLTAGAEAARHQRGAPEQSVHADGDEGSEPSSLSKRGLEASRVEEDVLASLP